LETWRDIDPCKITIFRDRDNIRSEVAELCHRIEALSALIDPDFKASDISRSTDMRVLSLAETTSKAA
jgi:hypothetical protein